MEEANDLLEAIRSLNSTFRVIQSDSQRFELALTRVVFAGTEGSYVIGFTSPRGGWATQWDSAHSKWIELPELSSPASGFLAEAFVMQVSSGYSVSFSDRSNPFVRWGFTADAISIRPQVQDSSFTWVGRFTAALKIRLRTKAGASTNSLNSLRSGKSV